MVIAVMSQRWFREDAVKVSTVIQEGKSGSVASAPQVINKKANRRGDGQISAARSAAVQTLRAFGGGDRSGCCHHTRRQEPGGARGRRWHRLAH